MPWALDPKPLRVSLFVGKGIDYGFTILASLRLGLRNADVAGA